jgi:uncharacterized protein YjbJ (UPF0337 family)
VLSVFFLIVSTRPIVEPIANNAAGEKFQRFGKRRSTLRGTGLPGAELPMQDQTPMESRMDWARIEGNWKQVKGKVKEKWGKLTDDDLAVVNGRREQLEGKIQERYGYSRDQIRKDVDDWMKSTSW